ncbi:MAG: ABC transporter permease [Sphingobacteriales bacterium JAD_PAG50586_3]|nr:MAG: ABC transporter permease [Sphingobacteriales bacterium JAD_PAG50586_3]
MQTLIIQMPLLVALVTGDLISGEMASGTIRLLATRPVSRGEILWSKILAGGIYVFALLFWLGLLALGGGLLFFGTGDLTVLKTDELVILRESDVIWRFISAFGVAFVSLLLVASFSLMLSCFTDNSIGPIIMAMSVIVLFTIIGTMEVPLFDKIKPFLFTTHMVIWRNLFDNPVPKEMVVQSIAVLMGHIGLFLGIAHYKFTRTDIQN